MAGSVITSPEFDVSKRCAIYQARGIAISDILHQAVETAAKQTKPAYAGYKTLDFQLAKAGGLGLYSPRIPF